MKKNIKDEIDYQDEFIKKIKKISVSREIWSVWEDVIISIACIISSAIDKSKAHYDERIKEIKYRNERLGSDRVALEFLELIGNAYESNPDQDFLGTIYMRLELNNHYRGQFFTPYEVSKMMAKFNFSETTISQIEEKGWISINDPACGAGALLIAAANVMKELNINYQKDVMFVAQDIDRIVGLMCYIQMSLLGCPGYVVIGNTITNPIIGTILQPLEQDEQNIWYTPFYFGKCWNNRRALEIMRNIRTDLKRNSKINDTIRCA